MVPREVLVFIADQLDLSPDVLSEYAIRSQTRYDQLEALYAVYGFRTFTQPDQREMAKWLLPVALATTSGVALCASPVPFDQSGARRWRPRRPVTSLGSGRYLSAQHLKALAPTRRRAILVVTVLEAITRLTDDTVGMFDRLIGGLFRRAERRAAEALQVNARVINEKLRLLAKLGEALLEAKATGAVVPWDRFVAATEEAKALSHDDGPDYAPLATSSHALLRRVGPLFLDSFEFQGIAGASGLLRALDIMRVFYAGSRRTLPKDLPTGFIRRGWRAAVLRGDVIDAAAYELCLFAELRDRLRAGDVWVLGSRQYRAVEDQLVPKTLFATMKVAGPLPVAVPGDAMAYLQERRIRLDERLRDVNERAGRQSLTDVRISGSSLKITPLQAMTPEAAEHWADRVQSLMPRVRITELLAEVAHWTGLADCFTHIRTGMPAPDQRVILTAALADATNLGLTRMAEACDVASYRQLTWIAGWHLNEEGYGRALARIVVAQQAHPLSARFGDAAVSSSDGQHFLLGGQAEVVGAVNPHKGSGLAISFYTWVSGRYAPFHTKVISVSEGGGRPCHRRAALSWRRRRHRRPPHRRRGRVGPCVRPLPPAGFPVRSAQPQSGRPAAPHLWSRGDLAGAGALHCRKDRRSADHNVLGRPIAPGYLRSAGHGAGVLDAAPARLLSPPERSRPGAT